MIRVGSKLLKWSSQYRRVGKYHDIFENIKISKISQIMIIDIFDMFDIFNIFQERKFLISYNI